MKKVNLLNSRAVLVLFTVSLCPDLPDLEDDSGDKNHEEITPSVSGAKADEEEEKKEAKVTTDEVTAT